MPTSEPVCLFDLSHDFTSVLVGVVPELLPEIGVQSRVGTENRLRRKVVLEGQRRFSILHIHILGVRGMVSVGWCTIIRKWISRTFLASPACALWYRDLQNNILCRGALGENGGTSWVPESDIKWNAFFGFSAINDLETFSFARVISKQDWVLDFASHGTSKKQNVKDSRVQMAGLFQMS